jgi:hypothetical protein
MACFLSEATINNLTILAINNSFYGRQPGEGTQSTASDQPACDGGERGREFPAMENGSRINSTTK